MGYWLKSCWSFCVCVIHPCAGVLPFWVSYLPNPLTDFLDIWRIGSPYLHPPNLQIRLAISFFVVEIFPYLCHPPPALCLLHSVRPRDPLTQFTPNFTHSLTSLFSLYHQNCKSFWAAIPPHCCLNTLSTLCAISPASVPLHPWEFVHSH